MKDRSGDGYLWRSISPRRAEAIVADYRDGVKVRVLADRYGVNVRTIYRTIERARDGQPVVVRVGDYQAEFMLTPEGPVRMTAWFASAEDAA